MWNSDGNKAGTILFAPHKKKKIKRIVAFLLLVVVACNTQWMSVEASDFVTYKYVSQIKPGKTKTLKGYLEQRGGFQPGYGFVPTGDPWGNTMQTAYRYKIRVPQDGIMSISLSSSKKGICVYLCGSDKNTLCTFEADGKKYKGNISIKKGTYYLQNGKDVNVKCKFKTEKVKDYKNYCVERAKTIGSKQKVKVAQIGNQNYIKWYKIKLTKRRKITIKGQAFKKTKKQSLEDCITLYDDKGNEISPSEVNTNGEKMIFKDTFSEVLEPGTYYIRADYFDHINERHWFMFHGTVYLGMFSYDTHTGNSLEFYWY